MRINARHKNRRGNAIMEYAVIIGTVALALTAMNIYLKRGIQGQIKDMTDYFISNEQVVEVTPDANTTTTAQTIVPESIVTSEGFLGGATRFTSTETRNINSSAVVEEKKDTYSPPYIPGDDNQKPPPIDTNGDGKPD